MRTKANSKLKFFGGAILSLAIVALFAFAVGCSRNATKSAHQAEQNILPAISVYALSGNEGENATNYAELAGFVGSTGLYGTSGSTEGILFKGETGEGKTAVPNDTWAGALYTSPIAVLHDNQTEFPLVQISVDGALTTYRIVKGESATEASSTSTETNKNIASTNTNYSKGDIIFKGYYYHLENTSTETGRPNHAVARLVLTQDTNEASNNLSDVRIVFHPDLSYSTKFVRKVQAKALPNAGTVQTASAYGIAATIQVRYLTFEATSFNSLDANYGYLTYDESRYAFSTKLTHAIQGGYLPTEARSTATDGSIIAYNTQMAGKNVIYKLAGYFADGRVVEVSRQLLSSQETRHLSGTSYVSVFDYDFQNWTITQKADQANSQTQNNKDGNHSSYKSFYVNTGSAQSAENYNVATEDHTSIATEKTSTTNGQTTTGTLRVVANTSSHKQTFYANYIKVNNFTLYGRIFNGDSINTNNGTISALQNVTITVHDNSGNSSGTQTYTTNTNGEFKISGLSKDAYITFSYTGPGRDAYAGTDVAYQFISTSFTFSASGEPDLKDGQKYISVDTRDKEDISVTATALEKDTNLVVRVVLRDDEGRVINSGSNVRYEVVQGLSGNTEWMNTSGNVCTSHTTDAEHKTAGCVQYSTTTVLVSVIPSSGTLVTGYELKNGTEPTLTKTTQVYKEHETALNDTIGTLYKITKTKVGTGSETNVDESTNILYIQGNWAVATTTSTSTTFAELDQNTTYTTDFGATIQYSTDHWVVSHVLTSHTTTTATATYTNACYVWNMGETISYNTTSGKITIGDASPQDTVELENGTVNYTTRTGTDTITITTYLFEKTSSQPGETSTRFEAYQTEMTYDYKGTTDDTSDDSAIYVYYSIQSANGNKYFIDPVAYVEGIDDSGNAIGTTHWLETQTGSGNAMITNGEGLVTAGKIVLGSTIRTNADEAYTDFKAAIGTGLRDNYYYYVSELGTETTLFVRNQTESEVKSAQDLNLYTNENLLTSGAQAYFAYGNSGAIKDDPRLHKDTGSNVYIVTAIGTKQDDTVTYLSSYSINGEASNVTATGADIKADNTAYSDWIAAWKAATGNTNTDALSDNALYFVANLTATNGASMEIGDYTVSNTYYYAFLPQTDSKDNTTLARTDIPDAAFVAVLGKVFPSSQNGFETYPNILPEYKTTPIHANLADLRSKLGSKLTIEDSGTEPAYTIDQTLKNAEAEGFLGATYLSGTPYPNPVFRFSVRHALSSNKEVELSIFTKEIYYVEALGTLAQKETNNVVTDFSSFAFRDGQTTLSSGAGDYIEKQSTIVTKNGHYVFGLPVLVEYGTNKMLLSQYFLPVTDFITYISDETIYYTGTDQLIQKYCGNKVEGKGYPLLVSFTQNGTTLLYNPQTNVWTLNGDALSIGTTYSCQITKNSKGQITSVSDLSDTLQALWALQTANSTTKTNTQSATTSAFAVWQTSADEISDVAFFDLHSYDADALKSTGSIVFSSGCTDPCIGLASLDENDILNSNNNYDEVLIAGLTSMYRVPQSVANKNMNGNHHFTAEYEGTTLILEKAETELDPYFYLKTDAVAIVAEPNYVLSAQTSQSVRYRFKEWNVYRRANSEVLYRYYSTTSGDEYSNQGKPVLYFVPQDPGYYLILPVYERVYEVSTGVQTSAGELNIGGTIGATFASPISANTNANQKTNSLVEKLTQSYYLKEQTTLFTIKEVRTLKVSLYEQSVGTDKKPALCFSSDDGATWVDENGNQVEKMNSASIQIVTIDDSGAKMSANISLEYTGHESLPDGTHPTKSFTEQNYQIDTIGALSSLCVSYKATDRFGVQYDTEFDGDNLVAYTTTDGTKSYAVDSLGEKIVVAQKFTRNFVTYKAIGSEPYQKPDGTSSTSILPTSYLLDRHTQVTLTANAQNGYRFEDWYLTVYDKASGNYIAMSVPAKSSTAHYYDELKAPSNIYYFDGTSYNSVSYTCTNGTFALSLTPTSGTPDSGYVIYNGKLYSSPTLTSANILEDISAYTPATGVYDDYIEYFYHDTKVAFSNDVVSVGKHTDLNTILDTSNAYVTKCELISVGKDAGKYAVHYVDLSGREDVTLISNGNPNKVGYIGTEVFYDSTLDGYFIAQNAHDQSTLVVAKIYEQNLYVNLAGDDAINIGGTAYALHTFANTSATPPVQADTDCDALLLDNSFDPVQNPSDIADLEGYWVVLSPHSNPERYQIRRYESQSLTYYYITRYYTYFDGTEYQNEVFDYDESAFLYYTHSAVAGEFNETTWTDNRNSVSVAQSVQDPYVNFIVCEITTKESNNQNKFMKTHFSFDSFDTTFNANILGENVAFSIKKNADDSFSITATANGITRTENYTNGTYLSFDFGSGYMFTISGIDESASGKALNIVPGSYELSSTLIYENEGKFYRRMVSGNIVRRGNQLTINSLDQNYFLSATFIEVHSILPFVEDSGDDSPIAVTGIVYFNNNGEDLVKENGTYAHANNTLAIRTKNGVPVSDEGLATFGLGATNGDTANGFLKDTKGNYLTADDLNVHYTYSSCTISAIEGFSVDTEKATSENAYLYNILKDGDRVLLSDGSKDAHIVAPSDIQNKTLTFDTGTSLLVFVRTRDGASLQTASLGLTNMGNLSFLLMPTDTYLKSKPEVAYYIIRIDLNHKTENTYFSDLNHYNNYNETMVNLNPRVVYGDTDEETGITTYYFEKRVKTINETTGEPTLYDYKNPVSWVYSSEFNIATYGNNSFLVPSGDLNDLAAALGLEDATDISWTTEDSHNAYSLTLRKMARQGGFPVSVPVSSNVATAKDKISKATGSGVVHVNNGLALNYLNLTSIEIYSFNVEAWVLDNGHDTFETAEKDILTFGNGSAFNVYVAGGRDAANTHLTIIGMDEPASPETISYLSKTFEKHEFSSDGTNSDLFVGDKLAELAVCVDTLVMVDVPQTATNGIVTKDGKTYRFAGWYQQKLLSVDASGNQTWSDLVYMAGGDRSFVAVSDADTRIIALYKEAQALSLTYNQNEVQVVLSQNTDSRGQDISATTKADGTVTLSGYFDFNAELKVSVTPFGGYRLNSFSIADGDNLFDTEPVLTQKQEKTLFNGTNNGGSYSITAKKLTLAVLLIDNFVSTYNMDKIDDKTPQSFTLKIGEKEVFNSTTLTAKNEVDQLFIDEVLQEAKTEAGIALNTSAKDLDSTNSHATATITNTGALRVIAYADIDQDITATRVKNSSTQGFAGFYHNRMRATAEIEYKTDTNKWYIVGTDTIVTGTQTIVNGETTENKDVSALDTATRHTIYASSENITIKGNNNVNRQDIEELYGKFDTPASFHIQLQLVDENGETITKTDALNAFNTTDSNFNITYAKGTRWDFGSGSNTIIDADSDKYNGTLSTIKPTDPDTPAFFGSILSNGSNGTSQKAYLSAQSLTFIASGINQSITYNSNTYVLEYYQLHTTSDQSAYLQYGAETTSINFAHSTGSYIVIRYRLASSVSVEAKTDTGTYLSYTFEPETNFVSQISGGLYLANGDASVSKGIKISAGQQQGNYIPSSWIVNDERLSAISDTTDITIDGKTYKKATIDSAEFAFAIEQENSKLVLTLFCLSDQSKEISIVAEYQQAVVVN